MCVQTSQFAKPCRALIKSRAQICWVSYRNVLPKIRLYQSGDDCDDLVPDWLNPVRISSTNYAEYLRLWFNERSCKGGHQLGTEFDGISKLTHVHEKANCVT